jgi:hypothetical protein
LALAAETIFLLFKEQVPLKFKKEISAVQCQRKTFRFISLSTPANFRWIVPVPDTASRTSEDECKWYWHHMIYFPETIKQ